jgi:hypothetical protein
MICWYDDKCLGRIYTISKKKLLDGGLHYDTNPFLALYACFPISRCNSDLLSQAEVSSDFLTTHFTFIRLSGSYSSFFYLGLTFSIILCRRCHFDKEESEVVIQFIGRP